MERYFDNPGEEKDAILQFEEIVKRNGTCFFDLNTFEHIIEHYLLLGKLDYARKACKMAIDQYPFSTDLQMILAQVQLDLEEYEAALSTIEVAETYLPNDVELLELKGEVYLGLEKFNKALKCFEYIITFRTEDPEIFYHLGLCYQGLKRYPQAIECYQQALKLDVEHDDAIYELINCLEETEQLDDAVPFLERMIDENPYSALAWYNLGVVHEKMLRFEKAIESYDYCIVIEEEFSSAHFNMGACYFAQGEYEKALEYLFKVEELEDPNGADLYHYLGLCYQHLRTFDKAVLNYKKALELEPDHVDSLVGIGETLEWQEKWMEAIHFYRKALLVAPDNARVWFMVAHAECQIGNIVSSVEAFEKASILGITDAKLWLDWSFIYFEQGDTDKAEIILAQGIEDLPEDAELNYRMTAYLLSSGKYKEAFIYLENALILDYDKHTLLFEFFTELEMQKALIQIIDQFRPK